MKIIPTSSNHDFGIMVEASHNTQNHTNSHIPSLLYHGHNHLLSILPFFLESGSSEDEQFTGFPFVKIILFSPELAHWYDIILNVRDLHH